MSPQSLPTYSLQIREQRSGPVYNVMSRWPGARQVKRTIGPAWLKRGHAPEGHFDAARAHDCAREIVRAHVAASQPRDAEPTFRQLAGDYLRWLEHVKGTAREIAAALDALAEGGASPRTANEALDAARDLQLRDTAASLQHNPATDVDKRREPASRARSED
jgi:hypothetical protein